MHHRLGHLRRLIRAIGRPQVVVRPRQRQRVLPQHSRIIEHLDGELPALAVFLFRDDFDLRQVIYDFGLTIYDSWTARVIDSRLWSVALSQSPIANRQS